MEPGLLGLRKEELEAWIPGFAKEVKARTWGPPSLG